MMKKSFGFTLGEILIALSVIGVVASLVIPQLVNGHKAGEAQAQFNTAYSLIAKAIADMDADNISVNPATYSEAGSFYPIFKQYIRYTIDCGKGEDTKNTSVCPKYGNDFYSTFNEEQKTDTNILDDGSFVLNNGMLVAIDNDPETSDEILKGGNIFISVDINGFNKHPNKHGYDLFTFQLVNGELLPVGVSGTISQVSNNPKKYCCSTKINDGCSAESQRNGLSCAYYALTDQDYFKKIYKGH